MKKKKIGIVVCFILLIYFIGGIFYNIFLDRSDTKKKNNVNQNLQIKGFEYLLNDDETELFKSEFKKLKNNLESSNINYNEYALSISKMFIIDLYTLNNKKNMYDVGGVQFVYPDARENFKLNVENTLYKYMEDNSDGKRVQDLPEVSNVEVTSDEVYEYTIGEEKYKGYKINLDISYVKDLEYDAKAELILVKVDEYLYIVEKN